MYYRVYIYRLNTIDSVLLYRCRKLRESYSSLLAKAQSGERPENCRQATRPCGAQKPKLRNSRCSPSSGTVQWQCKHQEANTNSTRPKQELGGAGWSSIYIYIYLIQRGRSGKISETKEKHRRKSDIPGPAKRILDLSISGAGHKNDDIAPGIPPNYIMTQMVPEP